MLYIYNKKPFSSNKNNAVIKFDQIYFYDKKSYFKTKLIDKNFVLKTRIFS